MAGILLGLPLFTIFVYIFGSFISRFVVNEYQELRKKSELEELGKASWCLVALKNRYYILNEHAWGPWTLLFAISVTITLSAILYSIDPDFFDEEVRGISMTAASVFGASNISYAGGWRVEDAASLVTPEKVTSSFFIKTKSVTTPQTRNICTETNSTMSAFCTGDQDCAPAGKAFHYGHGLSNGTCNLDTNRCFVYAWCPIDDGIGEPPHSSIIEISQGIKSFVVLIKNRVRFEFSDMTVTTESNTFSDGENNKERMCIHSDVDQACPIFSVGDILDNRGFGDNYTEWGGAVSIRIIWRCHMNQSDPDHCRDKSNSIKYKYRRLDVGEQSWKTNGYNYAGITPSDQGLQSRNHVRYFGVLFLLEEDMLGYKTTNSKFIEQMGTLLILVVALYGLCMTGLVIFCSCCCKKKGLLVTPSCVCSEDNGVDDNV